MTIQLEYSSNNADWSTFPASSVINGNNPAKGNNGKISISSSQPYLRVNIVSALGPGTVSYSVAGTGGTGITPASSDPGCAVTADIGKTWVDNTSAANTHYKVCASISSTFSWVQVF